MALDGRIAKLWKNRRNILKKHIVDATALTTFFFPIGVATDVFADINDINNLKVRLSMTAAGYCGLAQLVNLRDHLKGKIGISEKDVWSGAIFDGLYSGGLALGIRGSAYIFSGVDDWKKVATGLTLGFTTNIVLGSVGLKFIDFYEKLCGVKKADVLGEYVPKKSILKNMIARIGKTSIYQKAVSMKPAKVCGAVFEKVSDNLSRFSGYIQSKSRKTQIGVAAAFTAASLLVSGGIYLATPDTSIRDSLYKTPPAKVLTHASDL